ncbi:MAG: PDZ domain-containing protein [Burkholderiaceae bacterium]
MPSPIQYEISIADAAAHLFEVTIRIDQPDPHGQVLMMPAWIPGSYLIRDFARHVIDIQARAGRRSVSVARTDKQRWQCAPCAGSLRIRYRVYAWDLSVRGAHLDQTHAFFNGTSVFMQVSGQEDSPCAVRIHRPRQRWASRWRVATTLPRDGAPAWGFGDYLAGDYDELIDHPVEIGRFREVSFEAGGAEHVFVLSGADDADLQRIGRDLKRICAAQIALFEPRARRAPVKRYLFLTYATADGYGGLEHRSSTALICARNDLPHATMTGIPERYRGFLGLCSHEYFHTWNVKRIKPQAFVPYRLDRENHTRLLWVFEGFTSYYDDLMLVRSGVIPLADYLDALGKAITGVLRGPGRLLQSVADSSFDAWTRFYRQDENAPNAIVSYYSKGSVIALALDLTIRRRSGNRRSLDDVMRLMWQRFGRDFENTPQGVPEEAMAGLIREATGVSVTAELRRWVDGNEDPPLRRLLAQAGIRLTTQACEDGPVWLGARCTEANGGVRLTQVLHGGSAHRGGLSAGDLVIAIDGLRIDRQATLDALLARRSAGEPVTVHVFRGDRLMPFELTLQAPPPTRVKLALATDHTP